VNGPSRPIPEASWSACGVRPDLVQLLRTSGPGALAGVFRIPDPTDGSWNNLQAEARAWHDRGFWAGLVPARFERLTVFATDRRGAGLACDDDGYWFLSPLGAALEVGRTLDDVARFALGALHQTYDLPADGDGGIELGCDDVFVTVGAPGLEHWLAELAAGRGDDTFEGALSAEPLLFAYLHAVAALCSPATDGLPDVVRADALDTVLGLVRRRMPAALRTLFPPGIGRGEPFRDPAVRAWAEETPELGPRGPFGRALENGADRVAIEAPWNEAVHWPSSGALAWVAEAKSRCEGTALAELAGSIAATAEGAAASDRLALIRQITQLDDDLCERRGDGAGGLVLDDPESRAEAAERRLRPRMEEPLARALVALAILAGPAAVSSRATALLGGHASPELWLSLLVGTGGPMPWGADPWTFAEACTLSGPIPDSLVAALLPALAAGSSIAAVLLASRADRDDVIEGLASRYATFALSSAWTDERENRRTHHTQIIADDPHARAAIAAYLGVQAELPPRSLGWAEGSRQRLAIMTELRGPSINPRMEPPWRPGPIGPVTRALATRGGKRGVEALRKAASDPKVDLAVRDEATKGLLAIDAPGSEALADKVDKSWRRYWRI
jgi:hypothetical protein